MQYDDQYIAYPLNFDTTQPPPPPIILIAQATHNAPIKPPTQPPPPPPTTIPSGLELGLMATYFDDDYFPTELPCNDLHLKVNPPPLFFFTQEPSLT